MSDCKCEELHVSGDPGTWRIFDGTGAVSGIYAYKADAEEAMRLRIYEMHGGVKA